MKVFKLNQRFVEAAKICHAQELTHRASIGALIVIAGEEKLPRLLIVEGLREGGYPFDTAQQYGRGILNMLKPQNAGLLERFQQKTLTWSEARKEAGQRESAKRIEMGVHQKVAKIEKRFAAAAEQAKEWGLGAERIQELAQTAINTVFA
jgi:hypothetical protein